MKAEKLPSGNWRTRITYYEDGKQRSKSFTAPTKAESEYLASRFRLEKPAPKTELTVKDAIDKYIEISQILSPTTLSAYRKIQQYAFQGIMDRDIESLTDIDMQQAINLECKRVSNKTNKQLSPKTVKNEWGLIASAIKTVAGKTYTIRLPKIPRNNEILPEPQEIVKVFKDSPIELPCMLAMWMGLRMSEIRGLMCSSVKDGILVINQVVVDVDSLPVRKNLAKTDKSIRNLPIPPYIMSLIKSQEQYKAYLKSGEDAPLIGMTRNQIYHYYSRRIEKAGLNLSFHDLRHMYASICLNILQLPEKIVMDSGGWSTTSVMKQVYSQSFTKSQMDAANKLNAFYNNILSQE